LAGTLPAAVFDAETFAAAFGAPLVAAFAVVLAAADFDVVAPLTATRATDLPALVAARARAGAAISLLSDRSARLRDVLLRFARVLDPVAVDFLMLTLNPFGKLDARPGASREKNQI